MAGFGTLKPGDYIRFRYHSQWDYGQIQPDADTFQLMDDSQVPIGTTVHQGVWKGPRRDQFEVRRIYVKRSDEFPGVRPAATDPTFGSASL